MLSLLATGCIYDREDICPVPDENRESAFVNLCISVAATNSFAPGSTQSRAEGEEEDNNKYFFENGIAPYEEINSLRVIMVNSKDNKVEYNEFIKGADGTSTNKVDQITLRTTPGGKRRLWLVANEASLAGRLSTDIDFTKIIRGQELEDMASIMLSSESEGEPLFSNGSTYIPMTEFFDVNISEIPKDWPEDKGPFTQKASMFVTRGAVKFSFIFQEKAPFSIGTHYRISNITIHSTATSEYLFPNNTIYSPLKSLSTDDREIKTFDSPTTDDNKLGDAVFKITEQDYKESKNYSTISEEDEKYGILKEGERIFKFAPPLYFPETKLTMGCTMDVTVEWLDNEEPTTETYKNFPLSNLPGGLPRNTHVLVIISAGEYNLEVTVKLVPYIGVYLNYPFGFNELVPWTRPDNPNVEPVD